MYLGTAECARVLAELQPRIGNYAWMWRLMNWRARKTGGFRPKFYTMLQRWGNPRKPYFIGRTSEGIAFLGDYRDRYSAHCVVRTDFDAPTIQFVRDRVRPEQGALLDIGANMGVVAATLARSLEGRCEVLAFEPAPETARRAAATFALNGLMNVRLFPVAVGDMNEEITFYNAPGVSEGASAHPTDHGDLITWQKTTVPCRTLDSLMAEGLIPPTGFWKVDAEGFELKVMKGAADLLRRDRPSLLFEYFPHVAQSVGWTPTQIAKVISTAGDYQFQVWHNHASPAEKPLTAFPPTPESDEIVDIYAECLDQKAQRDSAPVGTTNIPRQVSSV